MKIIGATSDFSVRGSGDRVDEILSWLEKNTDSKVNWIAIDDMNLVAMNHKMSPLHFVQTSDEFGLTIEEAQEAVVKLR